MIDFTFPLMADLSQRPPHAVPEAEQLAELLEAQRQLLAEAPDRVRRGLVTQDEVERRYRLLRDIHADCAGPRDEAWVARRAASPFRWGHKVEELRREILHRRKLYPQRIARGLTSPSDCAPHLERLEAIHWRYVAELDFLEPKEGATRAERMGHIERLCAAHAHWLAAALHGHDRALGGICALAWWNLAEFLEHYDADYRAELLDRFPDIHPVLGMAA